MVRNYLKIAFRNISKYRWYSMVNVTGLAGSIAITILILFYARSVLTYDQFHTDADRIYFMYRDRATEDGRLDVFDTWFPLVDAAKEEFEEVEEGTRLVTVGSTWLELDEKRFEQRLTYADSNFFRVFSFPLVRGDRSTALDDPNSVVITMEISRKFFGDKDPIGKTINFGLNNDRTVTGVLGAIPSNSSYTFECIAPLSTSLVRRWMGENLWGGSFCDSFVKLGKNVEADALQSKLGLIMDKYVNEQEQGDFLLLPLRGYFDKMTGQRKYAHMVLMVALGIMIIAVINFTNLATAQSLQRTKEVGIRKVMGASKSKLLRQFLGESLILSIIALVIGGLLAELLLPRFNGLVNMDLDIQYFSNPEDLLMVIALGTIAGLASGLYPAFFASGFGANHLLKGSLPRRGKLVFRSSLVTIQFVLAIALMSSVGIIIKQIDHLKNHDLKFDQQNVMVIPLSINDFRDPSAAIPRIISFRNELRNITGVQEVAGSSSVPGNYRRTFTLFIAEGQEDIILDWQVAVVDHAFFNTYGIDFLEGRNFREDSKYDFENGVILNRAALEQIGWEKVDGRKLLLPRSRQEVDVLGVVENFNVQSLKEAIMPLVHYYGGDSARSYRYISVKMNHQSRENIMAAIPQVWEKMEFDQPYESYFPTDRFKNLYDTEENLASVLTFSMIFAVFVACLGLYALSSFTIRIRRKEIAIRKVLGASILKIITIFSKKYVLVVLLASAPAMVISWYGMNQWLLDFAYRISIGPRVFATVIVASCLIAFLTVLFQVMKAGFSNPIDALKED